MFCPACGASNEGASRYCIKCGRPLPASVGSQAQPLQATPRTRSRIATWLPLLLVGAAVVLAAVFAVPRLLDATGITDNPERAAREWAQAVLSENSARAEARTCSELLREFSSEGRSYYYGSDAPKNMQVDLSGLTFTVIQRQADSAIVRISGVYRTVTDGVADSEEVETTFRFVRERGKWRYCGHMWE